jgi:hypothetical protein
MVRHVRSEGGGTKAGVPGNRALPLWRVGRAQPAATKGAKPRISQIYRIKTSRIPNHHFSFLSVKSVKSVVTSFRVSPFPSEIHPELTHERPKMSPRIQVNKGQ